MSGELLCIGLSHKSAPLSVRERLALSVEEQGKALLALAEALPEAVLVSTCNRVELYLAASTAEFNCF